MKARVLISCLEAHLIKLLLQSFIWTAAVANQLIIINMVFLEAKHLGQITVSE